MPGRGARRVRAVTALFAMAAALAAGVFVSAARETAPADQLVPTATTRAVSTSSTVETWLCPADGRWFRTGRLEARRIGGCHQ